MNVSAFQDCIFRESDTWRDIPVGFAHGLKGNMTLNTDCVSTTEELMTSVVDLAIAFYNIGTNILEPYHLFSYYMIAQGN